MRRTGYQIKGQTKIGVEFTGANGFYFWAPDADRLYQWAGSGWHQIPVSNLGAKRRETLLRVWRVSA
jgi:hypothetical protein